MSINVVCVVVGFYTAHLGVCIFGCILFLGWFWLLLDCEGFFFHKYVGFVGCGYGVCRRLCLLISE